MGDFYGLIGKKLGHSLSPEIHKEILKLIKSKGEYNLFEIEGDKLKIALEGLVALGAKGVNVTIPYKIDIMKFLHHISPEVNKTGAVNTIAFKDDTLIGYNTDYYGFGLSLKNSNIDVLGKKAVILGTGGASRAVSQYLIDNKISELVYVSRNVGKVSENIKKHNIISYRDVVKLGKWDIIVNCTPCGMYPREEDCPIDKKLLENFSTAVDLIYNPEETVFLRYAKELSLNTVNGLYMLVAQAVAAQEIWNETHIGKDKIDDIYEKMRGITNNLKKYDEM